MDFANWTTENFTILGYVGYLVLSIGLTVWVARTLRKNGRIFLVDAMRGNGELADSVNHLLVVGFYLINVGFVTLSLKYAIKPTSLTETLEFCSGKIGRVLVVLGIMHFFNLFILSLMRRRTTGRRTLAPTAAPNDLPVASGTYAG